MPELRRPEVPIVRVSLIDAGTWGGKTVLACETVDVPDPATARALYECLVKKAARD